MHIADRLPWVWEPPEPEVVAECAHCRGDVFASQEVWVNRLTRQIFHIDCFDDWLRDQGFEQTDIISYFETSADYREP